MKDKTKKGTVLCGRFGGLHSYSNLTPQKGKRQVASNNNGFGAIV